MRTVVQRVNSARVLVDGCVTGRIQSGLLALLGVAATDTEDQAKAMAAKIARLRIFQDPSEKMNLSVLDTGGAVLAVSQFTLLADARKGNRPSFVDAARPEVAEPLYERFCWELEAQGIHVERGVFGAHMHVELENDGPVTILLDM